MAPDPPAAPSLMNMAENSEPPLTGRKFRKFGQLARDEYLKAIREKGLSLRKAAEAVGIHRDTIYAYRMANPDYEIELQKARMSAIEFVEDALYEEASRGNVRAIEFYLCNRAPDRWADRRSVECKAEVEAVKVDPLPAVLEVLDAHPDAKADLIKRIEMVSP
ncbi:MAG: hypothetical protein A4E30_00165 [Methanomassiliicoccales archaeon PtaB.Bin215]|nr:MAG: hypothetical protein A4E30_00165 [Methanomassiliicoccales archaeon PtaB.Bin215]